MGKKWAVGGRQWAVMQGAGVLSALTGMSCALAATPTINFVPPHSSLPTAYRPLPTPRRGISLLEVLISMFVLLFGLMGVAAVFPVGNHFAGKGEQYDRGAALAEQAFADIKARGMLNPRAWLYAERVDSAWGAGQNGFGVVHSTNSSFNIPTNAGSNYGPGHAFVLDPMGVADLTPTTPATAGVYTFPFGQTTPISGQWTHPWPYSASEPRGLAGAKWPIRRITLPATDPLLQNMTPRVAEKLCRLHDDLANETPEEDDRPGIYRFAADNNGTPKDLTDDIPLARDYAGSYSWLATIVPTASPTGVGVQIDYPVNLLQPMRAEYGSALYEVSVAVFHKREVTPSAASERMLAAELFVGAELVVYADNAVDVDAAVLDIRASNWIAVAGVQPSGKFLLKWYKILSIDDETVDVDVTIGGTLETRLGRRLAIEGPDWPADALVDLRAILLPGVIGVSTQSLPMERN